MYVEQVYIFYYAKRMMEPILFILAKLKMFMKDFVSIFMTISPEKKHIIGIPQSLLSDAI